MKYIYRIYQLFVAIPLLLVWTIIIALMVIVGCAVGNGHFWGYYPGRWWGKAIIRLLLLPVKVEGREKLEKNKSYVFVANHQGAFDIFLIYGFLGRNFKWMMKYQILKIPFVGQACKASRQIIIDKRGPKRIKDSYDKAREVLKDGISLVVFPEGARSFTGHMGKFTRGAFMLADELQLPVVPLTINGSFNVLPRTNDWHFVDWHPLSLTIHQPLYPVGQGTTNITTTLNDSYEAVMSGLVPEYQGFQENPDQ
ncbi:MAG: 1-acyl-sn-glycerol-3-phosphate acyltransferase [Prevotella sp.]|nr:1-acyl-sn-glycerol-3-phosphate acyltransferase [Prevotella sp.]MBR3089588.1 1-acyl-sn-glycerol-3-phosphate acyltransferase [Prevotella sp.]